MKFLKTCFFLFCLLAFLGVQAQQKPIPLQQYYKTQFLKYSGKNALASFYPVNESLLNINDSIKDTTVFYYDFFVWLFQRNWIELQQKEGKISINPFVNLSYGQKLAGNDTLPLYRNMRGINISGEFFHKLGFSLNICENQARFQEYERQYFEERGELYDLGTFYEKANAVIPGAGRTKPFKTQAYDYAYSFGSFSYKINNSLRLDAGNSTHFVGSGYRSLLLSDNAVYAPFIRLDWQISPMWSYQVLYRKHRNLFRKPVTKAVESSYENKLFAANYLTFKPADNFAVSLFTAGNQLRADSISYYGLQPQMLVPLPFFSSDLAFTSSKINGIGGLNIDLAFKKIKLYGQLAIDKFHDSYLAAFQSGAYYFDAFRVDNLNLQLEVNSVPDNFYASDDPKLAYSQYNLPLAHVKGNNFTEVYGNIQYEFKRMYMAYSFVYYQTRGGNIPQQIQSNSIFQTDKPLDLMNSGSTLIQTHEIGYRINRLYNPTLFIQTQLRSAVFNPEKSNYSYVMFGLKVNLHNQYLDF